MPLFVLAIFSGAFLLFQVQPLIGKYILPWFGGGPGVWTTCMLFFQLVLLAGYAYAHCVSRLFRPRTQALVHLVLLLGALACLPIIPAERWKPVGTGNPTLQILSLLAVTVGFPYFVLSTTAPLLQQWFARAYPGASPYRLYALSNTASLFALLSYPFYFESHFTRKFQTGFWGAGLLVYAICCGCCAAKFLSKKGPGPRGPDVEISLISEPVSSAGPLSSRLFLWIALPACASVLLLATTNKMCQDVAVIPFLWVLPLALYLLSFVISFDSPRWYVRLPFAVALTTAIFAICWVQFKGTDASLFTQLAIYAGGLFCCCMVCHGELYRLRPEPARLTLFYFMIACGGALGGIFSAIISPVIFHDFYELHWGLWVCAALFFIVCCVAPKTANEGLVRSALESWRGLACILPVMLCAVLDRVFQHVIAETRTVPNSVLRWARLGLWFAFGILVISWIARGKMRAFRYWRALTCIWLFLGLVGLAAALWILAHNSSNEKILASRNFYGVLSVYEHRRDEPDGHHFLLQHGRITHGLQFVDPRLSRQPTTYYAEASGVGLAVRALPNSQRRIGVVGLGTGSIAVYGRKGDYFRIYEINPEVKRLATTTFTYLKDSPGKVELVMGDARLSMERESAQNFDLLVLDAFSSDAIPVHLLTREAFELYLHHLQSNGIIAVHISNHYLDLEPVVANAAKEFGLKLASIDFEEDDEEWWLYSSTWILLSRDSALLDQPQIRSSISAVKTNSTVPLWTDDFASLYQILKR